MEEDSLKRDLRRYAQQTNVRLFLGALVLLFLVGDGLIYVLYGRSAAFAGLLCLLAGMTPVGLTLLTMILLGWITRRLDR